MNLPYNATIPTVKSTFYVNMDSALIARVDKIYVVNQSSILVDFHLWIENDGKEAMLIKTIMPASCLLEFAGPLYLRKGDKLIGKINEKDVVVSVSIQGTMITK